MTTEQHLGNHHVYGDKIAAIYATADGNLRVALVGGGREIQSWPIARTTEAIREIGGRLRAVREALIAKHGPDTAGAPRAVATPGPKLDDAGLATPKRAKPADSWKGDADAVKALQSVETILPLLPPGRPFDAGRKAVAEVRAWIETGVDKRSPFEAPYMDVDSRESAMREAARGGSAELRSAVAAVANLASGRFGNAHSVAKQLAEVIRFEARDGNWTQLVTRVWNDPNFGQTYALNPRIAPVPAPEGQAAIDEAIRMTVSASDGGRFVGRYDRGDRIGWTWMSDDAHLWIAVAKGAAESTLRTIEDSILHNKERLIEEAEKFRRSSATPSHYPSNFSAALTLNDQRTRLLTFANARRAGLQSPAAAAFPVVEAMIAERATKPQAVSDRLAPGVEAILSATADQIRVEAEVAAIRFDEAREAQRVIRVPQTADVAENIRTTLNSEAADLEAHTEFSRRFTDLLRLADGEWTRYARRIEGQGAEPLVAYTDAAYSKPARDTVERLAQKPVALIAVNAIRRIGYDTAVALAKADEELRHLYRYRTELDGWRRNEDAWAAIHKTDRSSYNFESKWRDHFHGGR
jgi:hypothetical protein